MNVDGVTNGIVIDHISAGKSMLIYELLELDKLDCCVAIIQHVDSTKYGKKDIIKIDERIDLNMDILGYVDPNITVNFVREGKLEAKRHMALPETLVNVLKCKNPRCITSTERGIDHVFKLTDPENRTYRCAYCDVEHKDY